MGEGTGETNVTFEIDVDRLTNAKELLILVHLSTKPDDITVNPNKLPFNVTLFKQFYDFRQMILWMKSSQHFLQLLLEST